MTAPAATAPVAAPATLAASTLAFYALLSSLAESAAALAAGAWATLDPSDLVGSWERNSILDKLLLATSIAQHSAASAASEYIRRAVAAQTAQVGPDLLVARSLAGVASDGRSLDDLLRSPLVTALAGLGSGTDVTTALTQNQERLKSIVSTQVSDAGRTAAQVAMTADERVREYVRMLTPPSCGRCAILAGKRFKVATAFLRHPRCDCVNVPALDDTADDLRTDPLAYFRSLTEAEQNRYFTVAGAEAIRQGADINQVVNARRGASGLSQPGRLTAAEAEAVRGRKAARLDRVDVYGRLLAITTEGTTRRGLAGQRLIAEAPGTRRGDSRYRRAATPRLMPEAIAEIANGDREENIRLLRKFGYIL